MWRKIASLGGGQFMAIHQDGGMMAEHSRYDDELARCTTSWGARHRLRRGGAGGRRSDARRRQPRRRRSRRRAPRSWPSNGKAIGGKGDLVDSIASGEAKLADVQAELPADMRAMDPDGAGGDDRGEAEGAPGDQPSASTS